MADSRRSATFSTAPASESRPDPTPHQTNQEGQSSTTVRPAGSSAPKRKSRKKKKKARKKSFAVSGEDEAEGLESPVKGERNAARASFYRVQGADLSHSSLDSEALLDHREQMSMRPRRASTLQPNAFGQSSYDGLNPPRRTYTNAFSPTSEGPSSYRPKRTSRNPSMEDLDEVSERTPMLSASRPRSSGFTVPKSLSSNKLDRFARKNSDSSDTRRPTIFERESTSFTPHQSTYNVNYPPSVPQSPELSPSHGPISFRDVLGGNDLSPERQDDIDDDSDVHIGFERRPTIAARAEEDVCFPADGLSEIGDDDTELQRNGRSSRRGNRRRRGKWPDLAVLDAWSALEKEGRDDQRRVKRMVEPQLIGGRLRPTNHRNWHRVEEDAPYRFTYFNEEFPSTIHSQTISELVQPGGSFKELFIPDPPELSDSSSDEEEETRLSVPDAAHLRHSNVGANGESRVPTRQSSALERASSGLATAGPTSAPGSQHTGNTTPAETKSTTSGMDGAAPSIPVPDKRRESGRQSTGTGANWEPPKRYGERPTWWLDVLSPTEPEMKVLSKAFGIHPLTAEDIMMQEAREKVELFRNYYFVNYRSFEQDMNNEDFLEPVNMYIVVFREGVVSFHFSLTPHPANVRRRIRQLKDYLILSSDWISYAMIDDITDVFAPLIQNIEDEVDDIDDAILMLHSPSEDSKDAMDEKKSDAGGNTLESGGDMLRRVGDCRKKVMGLYRLLGNKADVIKGFAKRCNEHWEVAPRSEIGLYLGDIQDHIVTMTGNLSHYEKILARSHGNYLAQINIRMNERQEQTADVLGKLTVLGTIVLPMNIITGLWGMNVWVPGQDAEGNLTWFWCITAGLLAFGLLCFLLARTLYRIV